MNRIVLIAATILLAGCSSWQTWTLREEGPRLEGEFVVQRFAADGSVAQEWRVSRCIAYRDGRGVYFLDEQGREVWLNADWARIDVTDEGE